MVKIVLSTIQFKIANFSCDEQNSRNLSNLGLYIILLVVVLAFCSNFCVWCSYHFTSDLFYMVLYTKLG
jgi:hypothetical protein